MSGVRVLVGKLKAAFILTSDAKRKDWKVGTDPLDIGSLSQQRLDLIRS